MSNLTIVGKVYLARLIYKQRNKRVRSLYVREIFEDRTSFGNAGLVKQLQNDPVYHHKYFRMDKENFEKILDKISPHIYHDKNHVTPITPLERLAVTLRYLATGNEQISLAFDFKISPSSVSNILREVMTAICFEMEDEFLPEPQSVEDWMKICDGFERKWNFPLCCGAIDGKHIRIQCPPHSGSKNFNYKNFYSIVLLACTDSRYKFSMVDIGASGSQSDGGVLKNSNIGRNLENNLFALPEPKQVIPDFTAHPVFVGDDAFPLRTNLMKPFPGKYLDIPNRIFNYRLSRARMVVENSFGILSARFRIFHRAIQADLQLIKLIVKTCAILHNFLLELNDRNDITVDRDQDGEIHEGNWRSTTRGDSGMVALSRQGSNNASIDAFKIRDNFRDYFNSDQGEVEWQFQYVSRGYDSTQ